jgi:hypothetical protein
VKGGARPLSEPIIMKVLLQVLTQRQIEWEHADATDEQDDSE